MKSLALPVLACLALAACSSSGAASEEAPSGPLGFESLVRQEQSGISAPEQRVIRTQQAWTEAWQQIMQYRVPAPALPAVDFERDMVVLVALGERPTVGHAIEIVSVERDGAFVRVRARASAPPADSVQATVVTHPVHAVRVPRSDGPVEVAVE